MKKTKFDYIVCPYCGMEYLPAEIFIPNDFFGHPRDIEKDSTGKIKTYSGLSMDTTESFICDGCKNPFNVFARIQYAVEIKDKYNFSELHTTQLKQTKLSLDEK